jgi:hypothetical protein
VARGQVDHDRRQQRNGLQRSGPML